jgi:hypothetical protein
VTPRRLVVVGAIVTLLGCAVAAMAPVVGTGVTERIQAQQAAGGVGVLVGWALLAWGIHRLGRESRGEATEAESVAAKHDHPGVGR